MVKKTKQRQAVDEFHHQMLHLLFAVLHYIFNDNGGLGQHLWSADSTGTYCPTFFLKDNKVFKVQTPHAASRTVERRVQLSVECQIQEHHFCLSPWLLKGAPDFYPSLDGLLQGFIISSVWLLSLLYMCFMV